MAREISSGSSERSDFFAGDLCSDSAALGLLARDPAVAVIAALAGLTRPRNVAAI